MVDAISTALSGLNAASKQVEASASNIANITTTGSLDSDSDLSAPYEAQITVQESLEQGGVKSQIIPKNPGIVERFAPSSPFANEEGLIGAPNVNLTEEIVTLKLAETAYKANITTLKAVNAINDALFGIFDEEA